MCSLSHFGERTLIMTEAPLANVFAEALDKNDTSFRIEEKRSRNTQHYKGTGITSEIVCYIVHYRNGKKALVSWGGNFPGWLAIRALGFSPWPKPTIPRAKNGRFVSVVKP